MLDTRTTHDESYSVDIRRYMEQFISMHAQHRVNQITCKEEGRNLKSSKPSGTLSTLLIEKEHQTYKDSKGVVTMSVVSNQKRKRPTADHSLGYETEEGNNCSIKTRKVDQDVQLFTADASDSAESPIHSTTMTVDENISSVDKSLGEELPNVLNEEQVNSRQVIEPTSAHKKILQRQWSAEAHGHIRKVHSIQDESIEIEEESIGTEILSVKCHFESNTILDIHMSGQKKNGSGKTSSLIKSNDVTAERKDVAKAVTKPRVSVQRPAEVSVNKKAIVTPLVVTSDLENTSKVASTPDPATSVSAAALLSNAVETIPACTDLKEVEAIKDATKVPKKNTTTKAIFLWVMILGFLSIAAALYLSLAVPSTNSSETQVGEAKSNKERVADILLIPEVDDPVFSRSEQLLQQLDKLEQEASQLTDILNYAATHEAEAQVQLEAQKAEQTKLQIDATASIRNIESAIAAREEKISAIAATAMSLVEESEEFVNIVEAKNKEEEQAVASLTAILDKERLLESYLPRLESGVLLKVTDTSADSIADIDALLEGVTDGLDDVGADEDVSADEYISAGVELRNAVAEEESLEERIETGISMSEVDMSEDATVTAAMFRAEDALSSLDRELSASAMDIDHDIKEHVSAQANTAYLRYAEAAVAASAASAAAATAAAATAGATGSVAGQQSVPVDVSASASSEIPASVVQIAAIAPDHHLDYAVWPRGGRVMPFGETTTFLGQSLVLTSPPYVLSQGPMKRLRYQLRLGRDMESADASVLLSHSAATVDPSDHQAEPFSCYAFVGSTGSVTVTMHSPVHVSAVQLLHSPQSEDDPSTNAPKKFRLIGWSDIPSAQPSVSGRDLGTFEYDISGAGVGSMKGLQSFSVKEGTAEQLPAFRAITVSVLSNHGDPTHTSICRVKVLGELAN
jgi:Sad1 / UNC-like C-terminal